MKELIKRQAATQRVRKTCVMRDSCFNCLLMLQRETIHEKLFEHYLLYFAVVSWYVMNELLGVCNLTLRWWKREHNHNATKQVSPKPGTAHSCSHKNLWQFAVHFADHQKSLLQAVIEASLRFWCKQHLNISTKRSVIILITKSLMMRFVWNCLHHNV